MAVSLPVIRACECGSMRPEFHLRGGMPIRSLGHRLGVVVSRLKP